MEPRAFEVYQTKLSSLTAPSSLNHPTPHTMGELVWGVGWLRERVVEGDTVVREVVREVVRGKEVVRCAW